MSPASASQYRDFAARLLEHDGALVEPIDPEGLEAMLPAPVQATLQTPELVRLGFAADLPSEAQRVSLESNWLERFGQLLGARGRWLRRVIHTSVPALSHPERLVEHGLVLQNAVYRLMGVTPAWTRCLLLLFRYTAISDEKRTGIITLGLNLANGSALDPCVEALLDAVLSEANGDDGRVPAGVALPPAWTTAHLHTAVTRALARVHDYYTGLRQEAWQRLHKQHTDSARERLRLEAAEREYQAKVADLRQKYDLRVTVDLEQILELIVPVQRLALTIKRRKGERPVTLGWHPLARRLEPPPCEWSYTAEIPRVVCDEALHLISPTGHAPCPQCDKSYCRAFQPRRCPKCG